MKALALRLIDNWQANPNRPQGRCRFTPSCSEYTKQAIVARGLFRGSAMGWWRIMRCNPWSDGGHDPVPQRRAPHR